ncbi:MAG: purine-nucleoside phosphorylase [Armatimonadetes bacterium]|nr:purine-nucleoside phosphorylase [Armatimonadota bacterium]
MQELPEQIEEAAGYLKGRVPHNPDYGLILGTGLGDLADEAEDRIVVPYASIPHFPRATAPGHKGNLVFGTLSGKRVVMMQGRFHTYEGHTQKQCTMPVAVMRELGVHTLFATAATGGLDHTMEAGAMMLISDHINFTGTNPLIGPHHESTGPRFPVMFDCYDPGLRKLAHEAALAENLRLHEGVYCGITGPVFFTRAELRMLMSWGAHSIGMSTVPEVIVARQRGMRVLGIAVISDMAIPDSGHHSDEAEILAIARETGPKFRRLLKAILARI